MSAEKSKCLSTADESSDHWGDFTLDDDDLQQMLDQPLAEPNKSTLRTCEQHAGFDNNTGDTWLYPSNLPQRAYQLSMAQSALFHNTLVVLPTGLGKTFIASVVMYNIYRWYPNGKIIFMAPTRPLVAQQIEACQRVMPFPSDDTVELTGKIQRNKRTELWQQKRVFFVTPQVVASDMSVGVGAELNKKSVTNFPYAQIKLVVVDEAHRAKGRYAYTEVLQHIAQRNRYFRVLALSATPGRTMEDVAEVVRNLWISHLEVRWDTSIDVVPYVHKRHMKTVVVPLGENIKKVRDEMLEIVDPYLRQLVDENVLSGSLTSISRNFLLYEQKRFRERSQHQRHPHQCAITSNFAVCISLYHALELLERHGLRVFVNNFEEDEEGRAKFVVNMDRRLRDLLEHLRGELGPNPFDVSIHAMTNGEIARLPDNLDFGHPKFEKARSCLLEHFQENPESRAIVFCEYRESVMLIYRLLLQHMPLLKPRCFVGHGQNAGSLRSLTQKQQIQIMQEFRAGKVNVLIATCIGEEGIDIGEVELIICFDISTSNPQRFVQRIGRTGRQKAGNVVLLVTEGREQQTLKEVLAQKDQINKKILNSKVVQDALFKHAPRLVPTEFNPKITHTFIKPPKPVVQQTDKNEKPKKGTKTKKLNAKSKTAPAFRSSQDLRNFFNKPNELTQNKNMAADLQGSQPSTQTQKNIEHSRKKIDNYFKDFDAPIGTNTQLLAPSLPKEAENPFDNPQLRELSKFMRNTTPIIPPRKQITDPIEQIMSLKVSDEGKRFILKSEPVIVKDLLEKIYIIESLENEEDAMSIEEKNIRNLYRIIENLLGGTRAAVEKFLDDIEMEKLQQENICVRDDAFDMSDSEFQVCFDAIFEGLENKGLYHDNFDYIQKELETTQRYKEFMAEREQDEQQRDVSSHDVAAASMVYDTITQEDDTVDISAHINENNSSFIDSKYSSQCRWDDFTNNARQLNKSTPLQGPLGQAFQRQQMRQGLTLLQRVAENANPANNISCDDDEVIFVSTTKHNDNRKNDSIIKNEIENTLACNTPKPKVTKRLKAVTIKQKLEKQIATLQSAKKGDNKIELQKQMKLTTSPSNSKWKEVASKAKLYEQRERTPSPSKIQPVVKKLPTTTEKLLNELDLDLAAFMEPFPEEELSTVDTKKEIKCINMQSKIDIASSTRSNIDATAEITASTSNLSISNVCNKSVLMQDITRNENTNTCNIPSIIVVSPSKSPNSKNTLEITKHLSTDLSAFKCKTPEKLKLTSSSQQKNLKSPSVFDMYLKNTRGRGKLLNSTLSDLSTFSNKKSTAVSRLSSTPAGVANASITFKESPQFTRRSSKRALYMRSDSSEIEEQPEECSKENSESSPSGETECEEIAETQMPKRFLLKQRRKRRRLNAFILDEAGVSGDSNISEDELDGGNNQVVNSLLASSDESTDVDAPTATQMHAHYLQSIKDLHHAPVGFKIPNLRQFNDATHIYSQPKPVELSQYELGSFIVREEDAHNQTRAADQTLSPLTRAERILKQQKRAKKMFKEVATVQRRRRVCQLADSSDED